MYLRHRGDGKITIHAYMMLYGPMSLQLMILHLSLRKLICFPLNAASSLQKIFIVIWYINSIPPPHKVMPRIDHLLLQAWWQTLTYRWQDVPCSGPQDLTKCQSVHLHQYRSGLPANTVNTHITTHIIPLASIYLWSVVAQSRGPRFKPSPLLLRNLGNFVYPTLHVSFWRDTISLSIFSGAYDGGSKLSNTWCKCVNWCGLLNSWQENCDEIKYSHVSHMIKQGCLEKISWES